MMKKCNKCGVEKPSTVEYFYKRNNSKDGLRNDCKECGSKKSKQYYEENKETILENVHQYRLSNLDSIKEYKKKRYVENIDKIREYREQNKESIRTKRKIYNVKNSKHNIEYCRQYRMENADQMKEYAKDYEKNRRVKDVERIKVMFKKWMIKNKDKVQTYQQNRRSREANVLSTLTVREWKHTIQVFDNKCCYCGEETFLTQDHFIPLIKGGDYTQSNIVPCCKRCNSSKKDKDFQEWYRSRDWYSPEREQKVLTFIENTIKS